MNWTFTNAYREYYYDHRHNLNQAAGYYRSGGTWYLAVETSAFDDKNRRVFKSFRNNTTGATATWYYYYDPLDRLTEVRFTPNTAIESVYQVFQLAWLGDRLTGIWQTDFPSGTLTKRYVSTDETNRPLEMWVWPASGDTTRVWAVNPSAWGFDTNVVGPSVFQPVLFAGQYQDTETAAYQNDGTTVHRPGLALNGFRTYDPFTGGYLQVDPLVPETWSSYGYCESDPVGKSDPLGLAWDGGRWDDSGEIISIEGEGYFGVDPCGGHSFTGWDWSWGACGGGGTDTGGGWGPGGGGSGGGGGGGTTPPPPSCRPWDFFCRLADLVDRWEQVEVPTTDYRSQVCTAAILSRQFLACDACRKACSPLAGQGQYIICIYKCEGHPQYTGNSITPCRQCDPCTAPGAGCNTHFGMQ